MNCTSSSQKRRPPVSDEQITDEQVVAQAVAPFVETVGDAVETATAVLAAVREAGFEWYRPDECVSVGIGRWVEYEGRAVARMMTPPPPEVEPGTYRLVPVETETT